MKEEIWKNIPNFEGYQVSNLGNVRSLKHKKTHYLKGEKLKKGYIRVDLRKDNKRYRKMVHRLVAEAFIPKVENKNLVLHKVAVLDGGKNNVDNLYWGDEQDNTNDTIRDGHLVNNGYLCKKRVLQYDINNVFIKEWESMTDAQKTLKINNISACCLGKIDTAGGFIWKYKEEI